MSEKQKFEYPMTPDESYRPVTIEKIMEKREEYLRENKGIPSMMNPNVVVVNDIHRWDLVCEIFETPRVQKASDEHDHMIAGMRIIFATNVDVDEILMYRK